MKFYSSGIKNLCGCICGLIKTLSSLNQTYIQFNSDQIRLKSSPYQSVIKYMYDSKYPFNTSTTPYKPRYFRFFLSMCNNYFSECPRIERNPSTTQYKPRYFCFFLLMCSNYFSKCTRIERNPSINEKLQTQSFSVSVLLLVAKCKNRVIEKKKFQTNRKIFNNWLSGKVVPSYFRRWPTHCLWFSTDIGQKVRLTTIVFVSSGFGLLCWWVLLQINI